MDTGETITLTIIQNIHTHIKMMTKWYGSEELRGIVLLLTGIIIQYIPVTLPLLHFQTLPSRGLGLTKMHSRWNSKSSSQCQKLAGEALKKCNVPARELLSLLSEVNSAMGISKNYALSGL